MSHYRTELPQLGNQLFLTDGGLETTLIFLEGLELPCFAAFDLLQDEWGVNTLRRYYTQHLDIAREQGLGFILESPTWRANADWAQRMGYDTEALAEANRRAIELMQALKDQFETAKTPIVISGNLGPRGDGYRVDGAMTIDQARSYHSAQINTFAETSADMVAGFTLNYVEEAIGMVLAAQAAVMPIAIAFTLETDGRLPSGESLQAAIQRTDATTGDYPAYYMINCAHPEHFEGILATPEPWKTRIRGLRANASRRSHAELDESTDLDAGDPVELAQQYRALKQRLPQLTVLGGCCGTDHRHVHAICHACA